MTTVLRFAVPISFALGLGFLAQLVLEYVGEGLARLRRRMYYGSRAGRMAALLGIRETEGKTGEKAPHSGERSRAIEDSLYGLDRINWSLAVLVAALVGFALTSLVFGELSPMGRPLGLAAGLVPMAARNYLRRRGQQQVRSAVRDFAADLRLLLPLQGGLGPTLEMLARKSGPSTDSGQGLIADRVRPLLGMKTPVEILEDLSEQLFSPDLERLVRHIRVAIKGGEPLERAVATAAEHMDGEIATAAEEMVESAPTRLIIPMAVLLLVPAMVLVFFPVASNLLASLAMSSNTAPGL
jgi:hypothetical protein